MKPIHFSDLEKAAIAAGIAATLSGPVFAESSMLTDKAGMTVYTFDKDSGGKSACYGDCAAAWPPVAADSMPAGSDVSAIVRDDGIKQAVYAGKPLYLFAGDRKPGDVNGDNVQNVWHVAKKDSGKAAQQPAPAASSYGTSSGYY